MVIDEGSTKAGPQTVPAANITFEAMLDETCERLLEWQVKYAVQRINEMEKRLIGLEAELDEFLRTRKYED